MEQAALAVAQSQQEGQAGPGLVELGVLRGRAGAQQLEEPLHAQVELAVPEPVELEVLLVLEELQVG